MKRSPLTPILEQTCPWTGLWLLLELVEFLHGVCPAGQGEGVAVPHHEAEGLGGIGVVALADDLVEELTVHMVADGPPDGVVVPHAEVVAGDEPAALHGGEVLKAPHLLASHNTASPCRAILSAPLL